LTTLVTLVVALVPGGLLGFVLPPGRYRWAVWASSPALTLGLITVAMAWLSKIGLPDSAAAVLVAELILAGGVILVSRLVSFGLIRGAAGGDEDTGAAAGGWHAVLSGFRSRPIRPRRADVIGLAIPATVSVGYGWLMLGRLIAPPGWDAMNHGFLTRRILDAGSAAIPSACSSGSTEAVKSCAFYPLAADVSWAQATQLSGGHIGAAMTVWAIVVGPLAMVAGVYACVRALGGHPVVAACAAAAPSFLGPLWMSMISGRVTGQTAPCMAGGVALLIALALRGRHPVRLGLLAGLASAGVIMTHTYDVLFVGLLALGLLAMLRGPLTVRGSAAAASAITVACLGALLPLLGVLLGANGERGYIQPALLSQFGKAFDYWVTDPQRYVLLGYPAPGGKDFQLSEPTIQIGLALTIACLLASPLCLVLRQLRWARPWLVAGVVFTAIGIWTSTSNSTAAVLLSSLWYGVRERLRNMILPVYGVLAVAGAVAIGLAVQWLLTRLVRRAQAMRDSTVPGAVAASILVLSLALLAGVPATWRPLRAELKSRAPVGQSYVKAFVWLAENTPPGKVVAYDRHLEFMTWSYADYGVPILFGIPPLLGLDTENYDQRWNAWNWLVNNEDATSAGCAVRRFGVEYVVVGKRRIPEAPTPVHYSRNRLAKSDRVTLVHQVGQIKIYRVTELGRACPASS
jgi:hypothetical protein